MLQPTRTRSVPTYDFIFGGNVKFDGEPLEDVLIKVSGDGFDAEVVTDADGKWRIYVPEKRRLHDHARRDDPPDGVIVAEGSASIEAEFGLTNNKIVNFFLGEGERRQRVSSISSSSAFNGLNFGLLLALAAVGLSLIFGTTGLTNFAHAEMVTFGALAALIFAVDLALPLWIALSWSHHLERLVRSCSTPASGNHFERRASASSS